MDLLEERHVRKKNTGKKKERHPKKKDVCNSTTQASRKKRVDQKIKSNIRGRREQEKDNLVSSRIPQLTTEQSGGGGVTYSRKKKEPKESNIPSQVNCLSSMIESKKKRGT